MTPLDRQKGLQEKHDALFISPGGEETKARGAEASWCGEGRTTLWQRGCCELAGMISL